LDRCRVYGLIYGVAGEGAHRDFLIELQYRTFDTSCSLVQSPEFIRDTSFV
jgi:hypothetical protein